MKLLQASSAALVGMALCSVVYAYQRTADFGFSDDAETNVKAEFYWSRLSYTAAVGSSFATLARSDAKSEKQRWLTI